MDSQWKPITPVPDTAPQPNLHHRHLKDPSCSWEYRNEDGQLMFIQRRFDPPNGQMKEFRPLSYGEDNGKTFWCSRLPESPYVLFNLPELKKRPDNPVLITEGEKACEYAQKIFPGFVVVTTVNGAVSPQKSDFTPLKEKKVTIWRDNDSAGRKFEATCIKLLDSCGAIEINVVDVPATFPEGWDLADEIPAGSTIEDISALLRNAVRTVFIRGHGTSNEKSESQQKSEDVAEIIQSTQGFSLFADQYEEPYARVYKNGFPQNLAIKGREFRRFAMAAYYSKKRRPLDDEAFKDLKLLLETLAIDTGVQHLLSVRAAELDGFIYFDLGQRAIRIGKDGWQFVDDPPILFHRYQLFQPQINPARSAVPKSIDLIWKYVNIQEDQKNDRLLLIAFLVTSLVPNIGHPVLSIHGPQGSAKTTLMNVIMQILDPAKTPDSPSNRINEFLQHISHRWVVPLDNMGHISDELSDLLCKVVTGTGYSKRVLYTDDEDLIKRFRRVLVCNGINLPVSKPDLLDRCLILELKRIDAKERVDEVALVRSFDTDLPIILGSCFELLAVAMRKLPTIKLDERPRMADFATWGCAVAEAYGSSTSFFMTAYKDNISRQWEEAIDASIVGTLIKKLLETKGHFSGTATELLRLLKGIAESNGVDKRSLPTSARSLGHKVSEIKTTLESLGYQIERSRNAQRTISISSPAGTQGNDKNDGSSKRKATGTSGADNGCNSNDKSSSFRRQMASKDPDDLDINDILDRAFGEPTYE